MWVFDKEVYYIWIIKIIGILFGDLKEFGQTSKEKTVHIERILEKIACYYSRDYQIPDSPKINVINNLVAAKKAICIPTNVTIENSKKRAGIIYYLIS